MIVTTPPERSVNNVSQSVSVRRGAGSGRTQDALQRLHAWTCVRVRERGEQTRGGAIVSDGEKSRRHARRIVL